MEQTNGERGSALEFALSFLTGSTGLIFIAALAAALIYFVIYLFQRRRGMQLPILRHIAGYAFCGYLLLLLYAVFFYGIQYIQYALQYEGGAPRYINLRPFSELFAAMFDEKGILGSQVTLNVLLFVPLGMLLPLVFPRKFNRFWKVSLCAFCATLAIETIQYFIGRSADVDDVIANALGGMLGFCLLRLCDSLFYRRAWWGKLCAAQLPRAKWRTACAGLALVLSVGVPAAVDAANARSTYGLLRHATGMIPENTVLNIPLSNAAGEAPLRAYAGDYLQTLKIVLAALEIEPEEDSLMPPDWDGASYSDDTVYVSIRKHGSWSARWYRYANSVEIDAQSGETSASALPAVGKELSEAEMISRTEAFFEPFLLPGESFAVENASFVKDNETARITVTIPVRMPEGELVSSASVSASFYGEAIAELNCNIVRLEKTGESVGIISEQDAYEFARRHGNLQLGSGGRWDCESAVLNSVTLEYGESIYGLNSFQADAPLIPYYVFSGTYQTESGETIPWKIWVDALRR